MPKVLIVYATTEGQTRKVAQFLADRAVYRGHVADIYDATRIPPKLNIEDYDAVLVAASLHIEKHQSSIQHFVMSNLLALQNVKTAFLSVSLSAAGDESDQRAASICLHRFLQETHWCPKKTMMVPGALRFTEYDFFKRWMLKRIAKAKHAPTDTSDDYEFTDWQKLSDFFDEFMAVE